MGGRGGYHGPEERQRIVALMADAVTAVAHRAAACRVLGRSVRTESCAGEHVSDAERRAIHAAGTALPYRELSPHQIVPKLADNGIYLASESTLSQVRGSSRPTASRGRIRCGAGRSLIS